MSDEKKERQEFREKRKKVFNYLAWGIPTLLVLGGVIWVLSLPKLPESEVVSKQPIHWHPHLAIMINNQPFPIPANVGAGPAGAHTELIHTHDDTGTLHLEKSAPVRVKDTQLGEFFKVWDKEFSDTQIFEHMNGPEGTVKMYVNGVQNFEYGAYKMRDGDKIEIRFD